MSAPRSRVTTHVLDAAAGQPAAGVPVQLLGRVGPEWEPLAEGLTDADGRVADLGPTDLAPGAYRLVFDTATYFRAHGVPAFYPEVLVTFSLDEPAAHYHVPLLLSPYAYSTYRGS